MDAGESASPGWTLLGRDGFEACSDPDGSDPWYEVGRFATEQDAIAAAWKRLRHWQPGQLADDLFVRSPDGVVQLCVIRYCRQCERLDAMRPTGRKQRRGLRGGFRTIAWEYACERCGATDWRERDQVFLIRRVATSAVVNPSASGTA